MLKTFILGFVTLVVTVVATSHFLYGDSNPLAPANLFSSRPDKPLSKGRLAQAKEKLTPEQYNVCVMGGTEKPFDNKYYQHHEDGYYHCAVCDEALFTSETKYDSGSGWPAFYAAITSKKIREVKDKTQGMPRLEVRCANCDAHLGHLFNDGPEPTGMRYCINSASLEFQGEE